ncbi:hypothetical protein BD821_1275 [Clostridium algidicarnis DSM 15099]|uniref:DUF3953 domain-containing protein n=1 Tax=Clostridium algidicarnis DSM 15099 TaxID=1121295 RepID=A0A2S6FUF0_9CLOT|nr:hypothetical protein BD821_1275 [Clostridium algidicarnis DSM 15099]
MNDKYYLKFMKNDKMGGNKLKKEFIKKVITLIIIIGCIFLVLGLLSLFGIINMEAMPCVLLAAGLFNISNAYYVYGKNKKSAVFLILSGLFSIFVSIFITLF